MATQQYTQTYNSFSGVDMHVTFAGKLIGELQGLSFSVQREKAPLYTMGSADPRSFSRGKRGISGSLVFLVFDRSALLSTLQERSRFVANKYELWTSQTATPINDQRYVKTVANGAVGQQIQGAATPAGNIITSDKVLATPNYHDQIPPFDIVVTAANEYGHIASMSICGVEIMNAGSSMSIDDINTDEACTFMATAIKPWNSQYHIDIRNGFGQMPRSDANNAWGGARGGSL